MFNISDTKIGFTAAMKMAYLDSKMTAYDRTETYPLICHIASDEAVDHLVSGGSDTLLSVVEIDKTLVVVTKQQAAESGLSDVTTRLVGNQWVKPETYTIQDYIDLFHNGSQANFARSVGVMPQQVTQWIAKNFFIFDGKLCSIRRDI